MYKLQVCDYDVEKKKTLPVFYRVLPSVRASRVITIDTAHGFDETANGSHP